MDENESINNDASQEYYRFSGRIPVEFKDSLQEAARLSGLSLQDWVAQACLNQVMAQDELVGLFGIARQLSFVYGESPEILISRILRNGLTRLMNEPNISDLAQTRLLNSIREDGQLNQYMWGNDHA